MTRRERVLATVRRQPADRVPMGEPYIQPGLCCRLLGKEYPRDYFCFERDYRVRMLLDMDLVVAGAVSYTHLLSSWGKSEMMN